MTISQGLLDYINARNFACGNRRKGLAAMRDLRRCSEAMFCEALDALSARAIGRHETVRSICSDPKALEAAMSCESVAWLMVGIEAVWDEMVSVGDATALASSDALSEGTVASLRGWHAYLAKRAAVLAGLDPAPIESLDGLAASPEAIGEVAGCEEAMRLIAPSREACRAILSHPCAVSSAIGSEAARAALAESPEYLSAVEACEGAVERASQTSGQSTWVKLGAPTPVEGPGVYVLAVRYAANSTHAAGIYGRYSSQGADELLASYSIHATGTSLAWVPLYRSGGSVMVQRTGGLSSACGFAVYYVDMEQEA